MIPSILVLPFDVISHIFLCCLPDEGGALLRATEAPMLLAGVCRRWRDIALDTHRLWNTVHLNLRAESVSKASELLRLWIPRAGNLPISVSLRYKRNSDQYDWQDEHPVRLKEEALATLIASYISNWTHLDLDVPISISCISPLQETFLSLRKLTVARPFGVTLSGVHGFVSAPRLREVNVLSPLLAGYLRLPWDQITTLRIHSFLWPDLCGALVHTPNLINLQVFMSSSRNEALNIPVPPLTRLQYLKVQMMYMHHPALLDLLSLPTLDHLEIDLKNQVAIDTVKAFLIRSSSRLRRLSVKPGLDWTPNEFLDLLTSIDTSILEELEFREADHALDAALTLLKAQPHLLPKLKSLEIERTYPDLYRNENAELFADFLESRWDIPAETLPPVQIKSFRLHSPRTKKPDSKSDAVLRLGRLRAAGMILEITCGPSSESWFSA